MCAGEVEVGLGNGVQGFRLALPAPGRLELFLDAPPGKLLSLDFLAGHELLLAQLHEAVVLRPRKPELFRVEAHQLALPLDVHRGLAQPGPGRGHLGRGLPYRDLVVPVVHLGQQIAGRQLAPQIDVRGDLDNAAGDLGADRPLAHRRDAPQGFDPVHEVGGHHRGHLHRHGHRFGLDQWRFLHVLDHVHAHRGHRAQQQDQQYGDGDADFHDRLLRTVRVRDSVISAKSNASWS